MLFVNASALGLSACCYTQSQSNYVTHSLEVNLQVLVDYYKTTHDRNTM